MRAVDLAVLYVVAGLGCAVAVWRVGPRGGRGVTSLLATVALWPVWAPFALAADRVRQTTGAGGTSARDAAARIEAALAEAVAAAAGTGLARLLPDAQLVRVREEVERAVARHDELAALLRSPTYAPDTAAARIAVLEAQGAPPRALATARLRAENIARLVRLRDRDASALVELAELASALRTQLVLARFADNGASSLDGVGGIVGEVWARVEGLSEAMDATQTETAS